MLEAGKTKFHIDLRRYLREEGEEEALIHLICEIAEASKYIINSIRTGDLGVAGTSNLYGEQQLTLGCAVRSHHAQAPRPVRGW